MYWLLRCWLQMLLHIPAILTQWGVTRTAQQAFIIAINAMKTLLFVALTACCGSVIADNYVNGYVRRDGTYVAPHMRSEPNSTRYDNYSTQGNTNPYTGREGSQSNSLYSPPSGYYQSNPVAPNSLYRSPYDND